MVRASSPALTQRFSSTSRSTVSMPAKDGRLAELRQQLANWREPSPFPVISSGAAPLDRLLPAGGLRQGTLVEWLPGVEPFADARGSGTSVLALSAAREAQAAGGVLAVVDRARRFFPPAAAAWGIDLTSTLVVQPSTLRDELWAIDQLMRSGEIAAVLAWPEKLDRLVLRRLQLAAEASGAVGLFVRPAAAVGEPTGADVRLEVSPAPCADLPAEDGNWHLEVTLSRCRGGFARGSVVLEIDAERGEIGESRARHVVAELADSAAG